jgi:c-di-GMP-binding flagellar brake protein YcgR
MELKVGETYIAYKFQNPMENVKFTVTREEDLFFEAKILEGIDNIELWKTYIVMLPHSVESQRFLEIAPYKVDKEKKLARFIVLGYLLERRKFYRFNVEEFQIPVESEYFKGIVENVSLGGMKIKVQKWFNKNLKEGEEIYVKATVEGQEYHFIIKPVKVTEEFISAKFEKPAKVTSEFFYHCLKLLNRETYPVSEKRNFRRFVVKDLNIIVDSPLGVGILYDISLVGMKIKLKKPYEVDPDTLRYVFPVSCYIHQTGEEFILDVELINKSKDGFISVKIAKWNEEALRFVSRVLELLVKLHQVEE